LERLPVGASGSRYSRASDPRGHQRDHARHRRPTIAGERSRHSMSSTMNPQAAPVLFEERFSNNGMKLGVATLNQPQTLNSLSLEMVDLLQARLTEWAADQQVAMVILQGAGEKAFCAGGDLHGVYRSIGEHAGQGAWGNP